VGAKTAGTPFMVLDDIVVLPNEESPRIALYSSVEGGWFCESEAGTKPLSDGDDVGVDGLIWRFVEATNSAKTELLITNSGSGYLICADFIASQNEEHVALTLSLNEQEFDMGERSHHYLLLLLARRYLKDQEAGFSPLECGWVEKEALVKMLRLDEIHINMQIYRFRKQLVKTLPDFKSLPSLIERRKGELRFVCGGIRIQGGAGG
ncbi:MAG: FHA domain-containing protein, partial [Algicola sp.]|nr:FHA domain-containing protein [Algicola sp.]